MRLLSHTTVSRLFGAVLLLAPLAHVAAEELVPKTGIFVLVDVSGTWLAKGQEAQNEQVIGETNKAVLDLLAKVETPAAVYVLAIEAHSVLSPPVCEAFYSRKLLNIGSKSKAFTRPDQLGERLELCGKAVMRRPVAKATDIHGALDLTSRLAAGSSFRACYLFMLSDFKEERQTGPLPKLALKGCRPALIYRVLPEDSQDPTRLQVRLDQWQAVLKAAGAGRAVLAIDRGRFAGNVVQKLLSDE